MKRTNTGLVVVAMVVLATVPALAEDVGNPVVPKPGDPTEFAALLPDRNPTVPIPPVPAPEEPPPMKMTAANRVMQGTDTTPSPSPGDLIQTLGGTHGFSAGRGGGAGISAAQEARRGIKKLIRDLG